jgi:hypothetical protein
MKQLVVLCQHWTRAGRDWGTCAIHAHRSPSVGRCRLRCTRFAPIHAGPGEPDRVAEIELPDEPSDDALKPGEVALCVNRFREWTADAWERLTAAKLRDRRGGRQMVVPQSVFDAEAVHWTAPG